MNLLGFLIIVGDNYGKDEIKNEYVDGVLRFVVVMLWYSFIFFEEDLGRLRFYCFYRVSKLIIVKV